MKFDTNVGCLFFCAVRNVFFWRRVFCFYGKKDRKEYLIKSESKTKGIKSGQEGICPENLPDDVADDKHRTSIIAKRKQVLPFCLRNSFLPEKICGNFGTHWITTEKSCDNGKRSVFRSTEESAKKRSEDPVQVDDTVCRNQKSGQNHKWKQLLERTV